MSTTIEKKDSKYKPRELELMAIAMQCVLTGIPTCAQLDNSKFAAEAGMTEASIKVTWGKIRAKLAADVPASSAGPSTPSPAAKKTPKRKSVNANGEETPVKKSRANGKKRAAADDDGAEGGDGGMDTTKELTGGQAEKALVEASGYVEATKLGKDWA